MADPADQALAGPKQIEDAAIAFVIAQEAHDCREAKDTRHDPAALTDLVSGDRLIEVKAAGTSSRGYDLWLEPRQYDAAMADPDHFWLYLVENVRQGDPAKFRLLRIGAKRLAELLSNAKPQRYWTVPVPVKTYDELASESSGEPPAGAE